MSEASPKELFTYKIIKSNIFKIPDIQFLSVIYSLIYSSKLPTESPLYRLLKLQGIRKVLFVEESRINSIPNSISPILNKLFTPKP